MDGVDSEAQMKAEITSVATDADARSAARRRRDVRTARDKLGEQFEELRNVLPKRPDTELTAKSQILEYSLSVLRELMTRATTLAAELAVVSPEATHSWMLDVSDDGRRPVEHTVIAVMKLFCWSRGWQYAEWWTLDERSTDNGPDGDVLDPGHESASESTVTANNEVVSVGSDPGASDNVQACVIRDSVSVMRLARTLINVKEMRSDGDGGTTTTTTGRDKDLAQFAKISENYQFRPRIGVPGRAWSSRRTEWLPGLGDSECYRRATLAQEFGMKTCLAVPVVLGGQVHSVMSFYSSQHRPFNSACHDLGETLSRSLTQIYSPSPTADWDWTASNRTMV